MTLNEWADAALSHKFGNYIDVDGAYQGQCWDLAAHYAREVVGCPSLPTVTGGAEGVYNRFAAPIPDYFTRVKNDPNDPNQLPPAGALIVYGPWSGNPYGHIEVVMGANRSGIDVIYQDGFTPTQGPKRKFRAWGQIPCLGWLVPKTQAKPDLQGFQRIVGDAGVYRRKAPNTNETALEEFKKGEVLDFSGWLYGQNVSNNNVWFKGRYSDTYFWSGAFKDTGTHDLADLNPVAPPPVVQPNQRVVTDGGLNVRSEPNTMAQIIKTLAQGTKITIEGYTTRGALVDGNSTWFKIADGWVWSGGVTDPSTGGITDVTPTNPVDPEPVADLTNKVIDISSHNAVTDYGAVKAAVKAVVAKAGHTGKSYGGIQPENGDPTFPAHKANFGEKLVGAYWYGYASLDPETEAKAFLKLVGEVPATFSYWLDIEELDGKTAEQVNAWCQKFLSVVEKSIGRKCGLYMNRNWFNTIIDATTKGERPIWLAHYGTAEFSDPVKNQVAHQYTSSGKVPGLSGNIDLNAVKDEFFISAPVQPEPTDPTEPVEPTPTDPVEPPKPEKPSNEKNATVEAMKLLGRQGLIGAISALLTAVSNWVLFQLAGLNMPQEILVSLGGVIYAALLALDKWIHENAKTKLKGIIPF